MPEPARAKEPPVETLPLQERIESVAEHTNSTSSRAINPARNSTTGSKPKRKFYEPRKPSNDG